MTMFSMSGSFATTRWKPPAIKWMRGLIAIAAQQIAHAAHVVAVPVGHDDEAEIRQIHSLGLCVLGQDVRVIASVEEDTLAAVFDQGGETPVLLHLRGPAKCIIKNGDLRFRRIARRRG